MSRRCCRGSIGRYAERRPCMAEPNPIRFKHDRRKASIAAGLSDIARLAGSGPSHDHESCNLMPKVLISDKLSPAAVEIFRPRGIEVESEARPLTRRSARHHRAV